MTATISNHLLDVDMLGRAGIERVLKKAEWFGSTNSTSYSHQLAGKLVVNLFYEPSTRTRMSFEIAARKLGAEVINFAVAGSSVEKGESLIDTVRTIEALGANAIVLRHQAAGAPYLLARHYSGVIINAGDGRHAHPTQALLDLLTVYQAFGRIEDVTVAIVGDIQNSRVARSSAIALAMCGANVRLVSPPALSIHPDWLHGLGLSASIHTSLEEGITGADVVMALRIQRERQDQGYIPSIRNYITNYGITPEVIAKYCPGALIMHPGPANEGVEISADLMVAPNSLIQKQVANGVLVRMAVLSMLLGGDSE